MKEINLRDFYPWYKEDVIIEVTEEVAEELLAGQRYIKASRRRIYRNKAHYSLDAEDGIEYSACFSNPSPQELIERMERFEHICHALNSLPDAQGQRVFEHYLLNHSVKAIVCGFRQNSGPFYLLSFDGSGGDCAGDDRTRPGTAGRSGYPLPLLCFSKGHCRRWAVQRLR